MNWDGPAQILRQGKRGESLLPPPFVLFGPSVGGMMSMHVGEGPLLYLVHWCLQALTGCLLWADGVLGPGEQSGWDLALT